MWNFGKKTDLPTSDDALPGRAETMRVAAKHTVIGVPLAGPYPGGSAVAYFGMGRFWGAARSFRKETGVCSTSVGNAGGDHHKTAH